ncbi:MAG: hypothetical protein JO016_09360 [Actinobacteria bacterium]|nr:hypothetical protein [Actinomycetota bacterium]
MPWRRETATSPALGTSPRPKTSQQVVSAALMSWAEEMDPTRLTADTALEIEKFLREYRKYTLYARREIAFRLRSAVQKEVRLPAPPSVQSMDVIATAVQLRRRQMGLGPTVL